MEVLLDLVLAQLYRSHEKPKVKIQYCYLLALLHHKNSKTKWLKGLWRML
jgi:hypothetical protein